MFDFLDNSTNTKVTLNTEPKGFDEAAAECRKQGGHLVAWDSYDDQYNAENFYIDMVRGLGGLLGVNSVQPGGCPQHGRGAAARPLGACCDML